MLVAPRRIIDITYAPYKGKKTGERTLMFEILKRCCQTCYLFLFDAGFYSFNLAYHMFETGQKYIMKVAKSVILKPIPGSQMPDGSYLSKLKGKVIESVDPNTGRKKWKKVEITVRVIKFCIPGFRPVRLITNLMDPEITAKEIVIHYHKRWDNAGKTRDYMLQIIAESKIYRPRRPRQNKRVVKVKMSNFKRKQSADKSEYANFIQDVKIRYKKAA